MTIAHNRQLTVWTFMSIVSTTRRGTKPRGGPVLPAGLAAVVPDGLGGRVAPAPHARVEAARVLLLVWDGTRGGAAEVRRRVVSLVVHTSRLRPFFATPIKYISSNCRFFLPRCSHMCMFCSRFKYVTSARAGST